MLKQQEAYFVVFTLIGMLMLNKNLSDIDFSEILPSDCSTSEVLKGGHSSQLGGESTGEDSGENTQPQDGQPTLPSPIEIVEVTFFCLVEYFFVLNKMKIVCLY